MALAVWVAALAILFLGGTRGAPALEPPTPPASPIRLAPATSATGSGRLPERGAPGAPARAGGLPATATGPAPSLPASAPHPSASASPQFLGGPVPGQGSSPGSATSAGVDSAPAGEDLKSLPLGKGLPVNVQVGVFFLDVDAVEDNEGGFSATVDLRLRWEDPRLRFPPSEAPAGFREFRAGEAEAKLAEIWTPEISVVNRKEDAVFEARGLRIEPSGQVELMHRVRATFKTPFDVRRYPFDRQYLGVELLSERYPTRLLTLDYHQEDLDFSRLGRGREVEGWTLEYVQLRRGAQAGWHGESHARMVAEVSARREPGTSLAPIFIPLLASLLIPILALWLNRAKDGEFEVEAFELSNVIIGGLFAVIALNFTVNSSYAVLSGDNPVTSLFGLNYGALAASIVINICIFRFGLVRRWLGKHAQDETFRYLVWAFPTLLVLGAAAILLTARA